VNISVTMSNRDILSGQRLIGADPTHRPRGHQDRRPRFPSIPWGDSAKLEPGQLVLAFGNPYGFPLQRHARHHSARSDRPNFRIPIAPQAGEFIRPTRPSNPGNSGGALVDARGELIGSTPSSIRPPARFSGMGFAIPDKNR